MAIYSRKNLYRGVNPHFNSFAQHEHQGWVSFHSRHVSAIGDAIDLNLPRGYEVRWENSLQIREINPDDGSPLAPPRKPTPDISVWHVTDYDHLPSPAGAEAVATLTRPAESLLEDNDLYYRAVVVYDVSEDTIGIPVVRVELLSPSNKPSGANYPQYIAKQELAIREGRLTLVVIDYLHESEAVFADLPSYPRQEAGAYPYTITVLTPRHAGRQAHTYGCRVDAPLPTLTLPLRRQDTVRVDFEAAYQQTFAIARSFSNRADYSQEPVHMERYMPIDQARIRERIAQIQQTDASNQEAERS